MKRGSPSTEPSEEDTRLAEQRGLLAGGSRWRIDTPPIVPSGRFQVVCDYSPSAAVQTSQESRRAFNKPKNEGEIPADDMDPALSHKRNLATARSAEKKHKDALAQKAKQRYDCSLKK